MIQVLAEIAIKALAREAVKAAAKVGTKAIKKAITKAAGEAVKAGAKGVAKKAAFSAVQKGLKDATALAKNIEGILSTISKPKASQFLKGFKDIAKKAGLEDLTNAITDVEKVLKKPNVEKIVKDLVKETKDEDEDLPFDSVPEEPRQEAERETQPFEVDETPAEEPDEDIDEMREQSYTISWYDLPDSIKKKPGKLRELLDESSSSSDGTAVQELIENDYESCTLYGLKKFVSEYNVNDPETDALIAEAEQAIADEVRGYEDF